MSHPRETADLPVPHRLALSYAPTRYRAAWAGFLALDARLGEVARKAREPMVAQIRLAWWREQLAGIGTTARRDEPLLAKLAALGCDGAVLAGLVDGWESVLLGKDAVVELAEARSAALLAMFGAYACEGSLRFAVRAWTIGEHRADEAPTPPESRFHAGFMLPRHLRPIQILGHLGLRSMQAGRSELLASPLDLLVAMRIGLIGR